MTTICKELPSGRVLCIEDIIYLGIPKCKTHIDIFETTIWQFRVTWASRTTEILKYDTQETCQKDHEYIKNFLLEHDKMMICD